MYILILPHLVLVKDWFLLWTELEIQKLWRSVAVDSVDERNIEEYLQRHNIVTMQDRVMKKVTDTV